MQAPFTFAGEAEMRRKSLVSQREERNVTPGLVEAHLWCGSDRCSGPTTPRPVGYLSILPSDPGPVKPVGQPSARALAPSSSTIRLK